MSVNSSSTTARPIQDPPSNTAAVWTPELGGSELGSFRQRQQKPEGRVAPDEMARVIEKSQQILSNCVNPHAHSPQKKTALVVGKVQSGKTLSFMSLLAMAHDNGFGLIVVLTGTKNILSEQSLERLEKSLGDTSGTKAINWIFTTNPNLKKSSGTQFKNNLERWKRDRTDESSRRVCVALLLKEKTNLPRFTEVLKQVDLADVPTLIIDDEADQASLNTHAQKNLRKKTTTASKIYREIIDVRAALPHHSYVQYTATPQATLLLALKDTLNPDTVFLLRPGCDYTGGETFFQENSPYTETIPPTDLLSQRIGGAMACPESLVKAFATFIYGSALELQRTENREVRTMMIHPSHEKLHHREYERYATALRDEWINLLQNGRSSPVVHSLLEDGRAVIQKTFQPEKLPATLLLEPFILRVLRNLEVREVNYTVAGKEKVKWNTSPFWCLVGGANLDRGFTVEGLTVTYMPRPLGGTGSADTMQQRARFFGYKKSYLKYCRVFLEGGVKQAFDDYVTHENALHKQLERVEGKELDAWRRIFILDSAMQLTAKNKVGIFMDTVEFDGWMKAKYLHEADPLSHQKNYSLYTNFVSNLGIQPIDPARADPTRFIDRRAANQHELYGGISLQTFLDKFIKRWNLENASVEDEIFIESLQYVLEEILRLDSERQHDQTLPLKVDFFVMRGSGVAERSLNNRNTINPFQGRAPAKTTDRAKLTYGGDDDFYFEDSVSVQLHFIKIKSGTTFNGTIPWLCYRLPERYKDGLVHVDISRPR
jgi:hypothetical protein